MLVFYETTEETECVRASPSARKVQFPPLPSGHLAPRGGSSMTTREQSSSRVSVVAAVLILLDNAFCQEECRNNEVSRRKLLFASVQHW